MPVLFQHQKMGLDLFDNEKALSYNLKITSLQMFSHGLK